MFFKLLIHTNNFYNNTFWSRFIYVCTSSTRRNFRARVSITENESETKKIVAIVEALTIMLVFSTRGFRFLYIVEDNSRGNYEVSTETHK